ncbi:MAG: ABC transporter ATP-binding protein [Deferribacteraceae bacterium]|jgi:ABC-type lipoprotein export system ATPase subunit|nr:ABC transporter ATP-binding protein [Deferribacteraceae bacterium]
MNNPILVAANLQKSFADLAVVKNVSLSLDEGEFVSLVGKSGSGKTTLLSLLSSLELPTSGTVSLCGKDIIKASESELALFRRANIGFIFQSFHLIPTLTAWENVAAPLFPEPMEQRIRRERAVKLLEEMQLGHRLEHLPSALSGGEKQRVAIARALINNPRIIFADEPTGNLDSQTGQSIMETLHKVNKEQKLTILMVTHDNELAGNADRTLTMQDGVIQ